MQPESFPVVKQNGPIDILISSIQKCPDEIICSHGSADFDALRDLDLMYSDKAAVLEERNEVLKERFIVANPNFSQIASFQIDGYGDVGLARRATELDKDVLEQEFKVRFSRVYEVLRQIIEAGVKIQAGGIKSVEAVNRRIEQGSRDRSLRLPDLFRLRIIFNNLASLGNFSEQMFDTMTRNDFKCVGCRNKYHSREEIDMIDSGGNVVSVTSSPVRKFRAIGTEWIKNHSDSPLQNLPTEIQLITSNMHLASMMTHPFREHSRKMSWSDIAGSDREGKIENWVRNLMTKASIRDFEQFL